MNIKKGAGPQRCIRCLRDKNEAIQEHLRTNTPCCPQCPLSSVINEALANRGNYSGIMEQRCQGDEDSTGSIVSVIVWIVVGILVYFLAYYIWEWDQIWAVLTAIFWPVALVIAFYYYIGKLIIGLF